MNLEIRISDEFIKSLLKTCNLENLLLYSIKIYFLTKPI